MGWIFVFSGSWVAFDPQWLQVCGHAACRVLIMGQCRAGGTGCCCQIDESGGWGASPCQSLLPGGGVRDCLLGVVGGLLFFQLFNICCCGRVASAPSRSAIPCCCCGVVVVSFCAVAWLSWLPPSIFVGLLLTVFNYILSLTKVNSASFQKTILYMWLSGA